MFVQICYFKSRRAGQLDDITETVLEAIIGRVAMTQTFPTTLLLTAMVMLISYGIGCFSTAYYLVRWRTGQDIRQLGSGTAGARNVGRVLGKGGFALTFLGDALKGALAVGVARWLDVPSFGIVAALLAVVTGHLWPVQLGGRGGKGASTALGGALVVNPWLGVVTLGIALICLALTRSFTRAGMIAMALAPVTAWILRLDGVMVGGVAMLAILLLFAHRQNWFAQSLPTPADTKPVDNSTL
jgi:glycerol-3-phosphate acyltransferase PlsY